MATVSHMAHDPAPTDGTRTSSAHWESVYRNKDAIERSWTESTADASSELIASSGIAFTAPIVDVGGGASPLARDLVVRGHRDITVVDISESALAEARTTIDRVVDDGTADPTGAVHWITADVRTWSPPRRYVLWHDRAVFHFMVTDHDREDYLRALHRGTDRGSFLVISTFGPEGPESCSGLPVRRWSAVQLEGLLGPTFAPLEAFARVHTTPWGNEQIFTHALFERR